MSRLVQINVRTQKIYVLSSLPIFNRLIFLLLISTYVSIASRHLTRWNDVCHHAPLVVFILEL